MCTAGPLPIDARQRMITATIELVGRDGSKATTVRAVAEAAGVSPALVMHHFGSKAGLVAVCDDTVMATIREVVERLAGAEGDAGLVELISAESAGPAMSYIGRALHDGGDSGNQWFDWMIEITRQGMADLAASGLARPADDPAMQAVLLLAMDLGVVLLRQHVERYLGAPITDHATTTRWAAVELDLLTHGVLINNESPPSTATPAAADRKERSDE
ncbi:MAG: TetR family transcriptional regulator [Actinomycetota bacterium]